MDNDFDLKIQLIDSITIILKDRVKLLLTNKYIKDSYNVVLQSRKERLYLNVDKKETIDIDTIEGKIIKRYRNYSALLRVHAYRERIADGYIPKSAHKYINGEKPQTALERVHKHRKLHPEYLDKEKTRRLIRKEKVLTYYGNGKPSCVICGFNDIRALSIDHINNDGNKQRAELGSMVVGENFYQWLIRNHYPNGYQTLCMNCQFIKRECKGRPKIESIAKLQEKTKETKEKEYD